MKGQDTRTQPALEEKEVGDLLSNQPTDILRKMGGFFSADKQVGDSQTLAGLARTSQGFHRLFQPAAQAEVVKTLSHGIVHGDPDTVYAILHKHPSLLLHTFTVTDPAGYKITATPYRAALCCQDPQMATEIQTALIAHAGIDEAVRQWDAQFPAGWEEAEAKLWKPVFTQLKKLDTAIQAAEEKDISADRDYKLTVEEGSAIETELKEFQRLLRATRDKPIETGRTFNPLLLQDLADRHEHYCNVFMHDNPKSLLFWQRIFGYAQGFLSAPDAQAFVAGLYRTKNTLKNKEPQGRNLEIKIWNPVSREWAAGSYYSLDGLGFDYGIWTGQRRGKVNVVRHFWGTFIRQKQTLFRNLCRNLQIQTQCIIRPAVL